MKETTWSKLRELWAIRRRCSQIKLQQRADSLSESPKFRPDYWRITERGIAPTGLPEALFK